MKKVYGLSIILFLLLFFSFNVSAADWFVDNNSDVNDIYTVGSASGSDAAAGTVSNPFATLDKAISSASAGDFIYVDAGLYGADNKNRDLIINKSLTITGAGPNLTIFENFSPAAAHFFMRITASNVVLSNFKAYKYAMFGSGSANTMDIVSGATNLTGIVIKNVWLDKGVGSGGDGTLRIGSTNSSTGAEVTIFGSVISCTGFQQLSGGGVYILGNYHKVNISNSYFESIEKNDSPGGAVYISGTNSTSGVSTVVNIDKTNFKNNTSKGGGGAIYIDGATLNVSNSCFDGNNVDNTSDYGNAILGTRHTVISISNSNFSNNSYGRGQVSTRVSLGSSPTGPNSLTIENCTFDKSGNSTAVYFSGSTCSVNDCKFSAIGTQVTCAGGTFKLTNSGTPTTSGVFDPTSNTIVSNLVTSPTCLGSVTGSCSSSLAISCVNDIFAPVIVAFTSTLASDPSCNYTVPSYSAYDLCDASPIISQVPSASSPLSAGTTTQITITATDANGNVSSKIIDLTTPACAPGPTPPAPSGTSSQVFCSSVNPKISDLVVTGSNIKWYNASSAGTEYTSPSTTALVDGTTYYASQTVLGVESTSRKAIIVTIITPSAPTTTTATQSFCSSANPKVANLSATGSVGSTITWYDAATGGNAYASTTALVNGTSYYATQTTSGTPSCESTSRLTVTVSIIDPAVPTTTTATQGFCSSATPKVSNLSATGSLGSTITWYDAATGGNAYASTAALVNGTTYYATQTTSGTPSCESTSRLTVTVSIIDPAVPTTSTATQSFCSSATPKVSNLSASITPGTTLKWYNAATNGLAYNSTDALETGKTYYAVESISGSPSCESSSRLAVTVSIIDPSVPTTSNTSQSFCSSATPKVANLSATGSVGSTITWYDAATGGTAYASTAALVNGTSYYATQTTSGTPSCESTSRLTVTVSIIDPAVPTTTTATQGFCSSATPKVSNLSATGSLGSTITWYDAATGGNAYASTAALVNGTTYYATQTTSGTPSCESTSRLTVTVSIIDPAVPTTSTATQSFCSSATPKVSNLSASITPGTTLKWYNAATNGLAYNSTDALETGKTYYAVESISGSPSCESSSRLAVTVSIIDPSVPTTSNTSQSFCSSATPKVANLSATGSVGSTITWYDDATGGNAYASTAALVNGTSYYATQTTSGTPSCESTSRLTVSVSIIDPAVPTTTNTNQTFCIADDPKVSNLSATVSSGSGVNWYNSSTSINALPNTDALINGVTYYAAEVTVGTPSCESTTRLAVTVKVNSLPGSPTGSKKQYFCINNNPVVSNLVAKGVALKWYDAASGGTPYDVNTPIVNGGHYFATQTVNQGCEGVLRLEVIAYVSNPSVTLESKKEPFCNKNDGGLSVTTTEGFGKYLYTWDNGTTSNVIENIGQGTYTVKVSDSINCETEGVFDLECIKLPIPQVVTPGDNGKNDTWVLNLTPKSEVKIFNRWGSLIYAASPYQDDWKGQTNQGASLGNGYLPSGTYFYTIDTKEGTKPLSGYVELIR